MPIGDVDTEGSGAPWAMIEAIEARILGSLIEKQATTPDVYPLTLNAVVAACNQKNNREPVSHYSTGEIGHALRQLEGKGMVQGSLSARASRYTHRFDAAFSVTARQRALLAVLMLRGPQTRNELFMRSERLADFEDVEQVSAVLDRLCTRSPALVQHLSRTAGQREDRYMHLLCGEFSIPEPAAHEPRTSESSPGSLDARVTELEALVAELQVVVSALRTRPDASGPESPESEDSP